MNSRLWPPAAAISMARLACSWPLTSAKSRRKASRAAHRAARIAGLGRGVRLPGQEAHGLGQGAQAVDRHALDHGGLGGVGPGHDDAPRALVAGQGGQGQHPGHGLQLPGQRQLPGQEPALRAGRVEHPGASQQAHGQGQVVAAARLAHVRRGEVHGNARGRQAEARILERRKHALLGLAHRALGQPDHAEGGHALARKVHFQVHAVGVDAVQGGGGDGGEHVKSRSYRQVGIDPCIRKAARAQEIRAARPARTLLFRSIPVRKRHSASSRKPHAPGQLHRHHNRGRRGPRFRLRAAAVPWHPAILPGLAALGTAYLLLGAGSALIALRGQIPDWASIILSNAMIVSESPRWTRACRASCTTARATG
jgi:hypothetical protein